MANLLYVLVDGNEASSEHFITAADIRLFRISHRRHWGGSHEDIWLRKSLIKIMQNIQLTLKIVTFECVTTGRVRII